jgi:protein-disulfide isomerase
MRPTRANWGVCVAVAILAGALACPARAQESGGTRCAEYPEFCVPHVGRVPALTTGLESAGGDGGPVAVRGMTGDGLFFLGNPAAPAHFLIFLSFTCSHCNGYYQLELLPFIQDYVTTGQAALHVGLMAFSMQPYADNAAYAAVCAGEQGAFWEMLHELFVRSSRDGPQTAFVQDSIQTMARDLDLDADRLWACIGAGRYAGLMDRFATAALDLGVAATPTVLVFHGGEWQKAARNYDNLVQLTLESAAAGQSAGPFGH